jgi:pimeloyl-ACP methyl ester carboxylesterase
VKPATRERIRHPVEAFRNGRGDGNRASYWFFAGPGKRPDPTPAAGPDPYGNPEAEWMEIDWSEHLRSAEIGGTPVNYVEMGEGPPIVFVHGLSGCWQNWLEQIPHFARTNRVLALDLPGFGRSPMPPWEISIPEYGRLLDDFCRQFNVHSSTLVGNSMGGFVAAEASIAQPDWVEKLVLVSAAGITHARMRKEPAEMAARMAAAMAPLAFRFQEGSLRRARLRWGAFRGVFHAPHRMRPELLWEQYHGAMGAPAMVDAVRSLVGYDFTDRLESVEDPTLIVWGRNDRIVPPRDADGYARHLRNSRVVVFDRCGHCPQLERPQRFNRLLEDFLRGEGPELARARDASETGRAPEAETVD